MATASPRLPALAGVEREIAVALIELDDPLEIVDEELLLLLVGVVGGVFHYVARVLLGLILPPFGMVKKLRNLANLNLKFRALLEGPGGLHEFGIESGLSLWNLTHFQWWLHRGRSHLGYLWHLGHHLCLGRHPYSHGGALLHWYLALPGDGVGQPWAFLKVHLLFVVFIGRSLSGHAYNVHAPEDDQAEGSFNFLLDSG